MRAAFAAPWSSVILAALRSGRRRVAETRSGASSPRAAVRRPSRRPMNELVDQAIESCARLLGEKPVHAGIERPGSQAVRLRVGGGTVIATRRESPAQAKLEARVLEALRRPRRAGSSAARSRRTLAAAGRMSARDRLSRRVDGAWEAEGERWLEAALTALSRVHLAAAQAGLQDRGSEDRRRARLARRAHRHAAPDRALPGGSLPPARRPSPGVRAERARQLLREMERAPGRGRRAARLDRGLVRLAPVRAAQPPRRRRPACSPTKRCPIGRSPNRACSPSISAASTRAATRAGPMPICAPSAACIWRRGLSILIKEMMRARHLGLPARQRPVAGAAAADPQPPGAGPALGRRNAGDAPPRRLVRSGRRGPATTAGVRARAPRRRRP